MEAGLTVRVNGAILSKSSSIGSCVFFFPPVGEERERGGGMFSELKLEPKGTLRTLVAAIGH